MCSFGSQCRLTTLLAVAICLTATLSKAAPPNILFCISDDQSYAHTGANGDPVIKTPAFDRVAREGLRFVHAFCDAPTCGPSRSAILTGQPIWRLEEAGNIHSTLPAKFATYTELLEKAGYAVGSTGKAWSPGRLEVGGRTVNPAGTRILERTLPQRPAKSITNIDYAGNFEEFLKQVKQDQPFCFWLGTFEPHRAFEPGIGIRSGKDPAKAVVPPIFPDNEIVRSDILDYLVEIEHFDTMVDRALKTLAARGQLDNTIVVVTSDHGMPFPRAKASLYDAGSRVPLAIRWPNGIRDSGRDVEAFVNLSDLAPTFLQAAGVDAPSMMIANSLSSIFQNRATLRDAAFVAMERHDGCRKGGKGYPCRAIRTRDYMYIYNFEPSRWPSGSPDASVCARAIPFGEIDNSPTKTFMMDHRHEHGVAELAELAFGMRPAEELYDLRKDPHQMHNVAGKLEYLDAQQSQRKQLFEHLRATNDPRVTGGPVNWDYYPYYGTRRNKDWKVDSKPE